MADLRQVGRALLSDADFNGLLWDTLDLIRDSLAKEEALEDHILVFYSRPDGSYDQIGITTPGWDGEVLATMGVMAAEHTDDPLAAAFLVTEAWMTPSSDEGVSDVPAEENPEREEVILISGMTLDLRQNRTILRFERRHGRLHPGEVMSEPFIDDGLDEIQNNILLLFLHAYGAEMLRRKGYDESDDWQIDD